MSNIDFSQTLKKYPDEELARIAASGEGGDYVAEAIEAAKRELELRGRSSLNISTLEHEQALEIEAINKVRSVASLSYFAWILFVVFGVLLGWSILVVVILFARGYNKKGNDALIAIALSFVLWLSVFFIFSYFV